MSVRMRHTRSHTRLRRGHHFLKPPALILCPKCKEPKMPHAVCLSCGTYKRKELIKIKSAGGKNPKGTLSGKRKQAGG